MKTKVGLRVGGLGFKFFGFTGAVGFHELAGDWDRLQTASDVVPSLSNRVQGLGFRLQRQGLGSRVQGVGLRVLVVSFRVSGFGFGPFMWRPPKRSAQPNERHGRRSSSVICYPLLYSCVFIILDCLRYLLLYTRAPHGHRNQGVDGFRFWGLGLRHLGLNVSFKGSEQGLKLLHS